MKIALRLSILALVFFLCQTSFAQPARRGRPPEKKTPERKEEGCDPQFLSQRRAASWYPAHDFGPQTKCSEPKKKRVPDTVSIPIYWLIVGEQWQRGDASARLDEAARWFTKYCITVPRYEVSVTPADLTAYRRLLTTNDTGGNGKAYAAAAIEVLDRAWTNRMRKPNEYLLILFVDDFQAVEYTTGRVNSVSGNFDTTPLILIPKKDANSAHIVTHELIHGLGKEINNKRSVAFVGGDVDNTWGEDGNCAHGAPPAIPDMGHPSRSAATGAFQNGDDDLLDWASYWEFKRKKNIK